MTTSQLIPAILIHLTFTHGSGAHAFSSCIISGFVILSKDRASPARNLRILCWSFAHNYCAPPASSNEQMSTKAYTTHRIVKCLDNAVLADMPKLEVGAGPSWIDTRLSTGHAARQIMRAPAHVHHLSYGRSKALRGREDDWRASHRFAGLARMHGMLGRRRELYAAAIVVVSVGRRR